jgi:signal transduction histidine kinase
VWLADALMDDRFSADEYIMSRRPKSVLCVPLDHKGKHRGMIYLENDANVGVFGEDRVRLVRILTGQLMNSMENALLVERLRRTNREMRRKNDQLQEIDKVKDAFLAVASHELRTPLNGIIGMASLMGDTDMSEQQEECLTDIKASSETLLELVNDVLDLSKLKAMKVTLVRLVNRAGLLVE